MFEAGRAAPRTIRTLVLVEGVALFVVRMFAYGQPRDGAPGFSTLYSAAEKVSTKSTNSALSLLSWTA